MCRSVLSKSTYMYCICMYYVHIQKGKGNRNTNKNYNHTVKMNNEQKHHRRWEKIPDEAFIISHIKEIFDEKIRYKKSRKTVPLKRYSISTQAMRIYFFPSLCQVMSLYCWCRSFLTHFLYTTPTGLHIQSSRIITSKYNFNC